MRSPISVAYRQDVASPYAEVMFGTGEKRKLSQLHSMDSEPAVDGSSPAKKSRQTWTERMAERIRSLPNPVNRFFRSDYNAWTPKSAHHLLSDRLNGTPVIPSAGRWRDRRLSDDSDDTSAVQLSMPESAAKFKKSNEQANEIMPTLFKALEQLEITNRSSQVEEAESAVRQAQQQRHSVSSSLQSSIRSKRLTPPAIQFFYPSPRIFKPVIEEEEGEESDEGEKEEESDILDPELEVIEEFISQKYRDSRYDDILIEEFDIPITRKDLETLEGLNWLNDEVINFYFQMIMSRSKVIDNLPSVYVFNTFFYTKLTSSENSYNMLKRWTRKVDIFSHDFILIPLHLGMHWTLCCVNCKNQSISYYDSMAGGLVNAKGESHMKSILTYLQKEHSDKKKSPLPSEWRINPVGESEDVNRNDRIPQQENGSDCGVFTCRFAEYISRRASFRFRQVSLSPPHVSVSYFSTGIFITFVFPLFSIINMHIQADMPYYRRRMIYEILHGRLC